MRSVETMLAVDVWSKPLSDAGQWRLPGSQRSQGQDTHNRSVSTDIVSVTLSTVFNTLQETALYHKSDFVSDNSAHCSLMEVF